MTWSKDRVPTYTLIASNCYSIDGAINPSLVEVTCTNGGKDFSLTFKEVKRDQDGERWSCNVDTNPNTISAEVTIKIKGRLTTT